MLGMLKFTFGLVIVTTGVWLGALSHEAHAQTPTPGPTATRTPTPSPTATLAPAATRGVALLPPPPAQIVLPAPSVKNQLVGDVVSQAGAPLSANYPTVFGDRIVLGMANLRDLSAGPDAGNGIESVEFTILSLDGEVLHEVRTGATDRFCAFGGSGDGCTVYDFTANSYRWPGGKPARSGRYTLVAFARGVEDTHKGAWTLSFEVRLGRDGLAESDGEARILSIEREGANSYRVTVETLGFVSFARSTHLIFYDANLAEAEVAPGAAGVFLVYPGVEQMDRPAAYGLTTVTVKTPGGVYRRAAGLCVAVVHPDDTLVPGRGDCVDLPR